MLRFWVQLLLLESWLEYLHIYLFSFSRFWASSIEWFWFFLFILNGVKLKTSNWTFFSKKLIAWNTGSHLKRNILTLWALQLMANEKQSPPWVEQNKSVSFWNIRERRWHRIFYTYSCTYDYRFPHHVHRYTDIPFGCTSLPYSPCQIHNLMDQLKKKKKWILELTKNAWVTGFRTSFSPACPWKKFKRELILKSLDCTGIISDVFKSIPNFYANQ